MELFLQQLFTGLSFGGIYACMALAVVMIYQATDHLNFAQGEMAMFSTYIAFSLLSMGIPYWWTFLLTMVISFVGGLLVERVIVRPVEGTSVLNEVIVFIGLLTIFNSLAGWIWEYTIKPFPSPFPKEPLFGNKFVSTHDLGVIGVTLIVLFGVFLFFRFTPVGLAMRAAAQDPASARLVGIRVGWMLALGWGLAAAIGAVAGILVAPIVFLEPNMMGAILLYGFAGALLGGISNPAGAVFGGFAFGVLETMVGAYVPFIGSELKLSVALVLIVAVLVFKPSGLFGYVVVKRV